MATWKAYHNENSITLQSTITDCAPGLACDHHSLNQQATREREQMNKYIITFQSEDGCKTRFVRTKLNWSDEVQQKEIIDLVFKPEDLEDEDYKWIDAVSVDDEDAFEPIDDNLIKPEKET